MSFVSFEQLRKIQDRALVAEDECERLRALLAELERERDAAIEVSEANATAGSFWSRRAEVAEARASAAEAKVAELERERDEARAYAASVLESNRRDLTHMREQLDAAHESYEGQKRNTLAFKRDCEEVTARATAAEALSAAAVERETALTTALANLAHEMRYMLKANPDKRGGLYEQRLKEADAVLSSPSPASPPATAAETYEPNGGNIYRPHRVMVDPGTFWRCKHGLTTLSKEFLAKGCAACESVGLRDAVVTAAENVFRQGFRTERYPSGILTRSDLAGLERAVLAYQRAAPTAAGQATPSNALAAIKAIHDKHLATEQIDVGGGQTVAGYPDALAPWGEYLGEIAEIAAAGSPAHPGAPETKE